MAKKPEYSFQKDARIKRIENCVECHGNPETTDFKLQGLCGHYCGKCMEVLDWERIGAPTVVMQRKTVFSDPLVTGKSSEIITTPFVPGVEGGQIDFNTLLP